MAEAIESTYEPDFEDALPSPEPLTNLFLDRTQRSPDKVACYSKIDGRWVATSYREHRVAVEEIALGLLELGAEPKTPIGILCNTRWEWQIFDMAIICIGGITVGIYPTLTNEQTRYLLEHSGARIVLAENSAQRAKLEEAQSALGEPLKIITLEKRVEGEGLTTFDALRRLGAKRRAEKPEEFERRVRENKSSDVITYVYTSGTTGEPKGAMLTHANFHYVIHATQALIPYENEVGLAFLPLAHSMQRYASYLSLIADIEGYFAESLEKVPENILEVRPTVFAVVPRVLEKIHAKILAKGYGEPGFKGAVFQRSLDLLHRTGVARRSGLEPGVRLRLGATVADRFLGQKIRERLGGRVKYLGCGSAPIAREVHEFFEDIQIPILEGWGLTETSAPACLNTLANRRIGTVGRPLPGTFVKIAEDGEILVRGPGVFSGYYANEEATKDAFDADGWFKTGDIGEMSRDGFLRITDRKKDLIITAGGKNVAPQPIEHKLKRDLLIAQAVVVGDRKPYLTALLSFDPEARKGLAEQYGLPSDAASEKLAEVPAIKSRIDKHLAEVNAALPRFEQIKRWTVLPGELTIESGELTPTMKVKRRVIQERHKERIERLYS